MLRTYDEMKEYLAVQGMLELAPDNINAIRFTVPGYQLLLVLLTILGSGMQQAAIQDLEMITVIAACKFLVNSLGESLPEIVDALELTSDS